MRIGTVDPNKPLKRCPCCGEAAEVGSYRDGECNPVTYRVICTKCKLMTKMYKTIGGSVRAWNRRSASDGAVGAWGLARCPMCGMMVQTGFYDTSRGIRAAVRCGKMRDYDSALQA